MSPSPSPQSLSDLMLQNSSDGILAYDREFRYTVWNPAMERLSGVKAKDVLGKVGWEVFPFLIDIGEDECIKATLRGETVANPLKPFSIPRSGISGYFEGHYSPIRDSKGEVIGGMGIIREVSNRARLEGENKLFRHVADSIPQIVWVANEEGAVEHYNQRWYEYTGTQPGEDFDYRTFVHPDDLEQMRIRAEAMGKENKSFEMEYRLRHHSGEYRWFFGRAIMVPSPNGKSFQRLGTSTDIHDKKTATMEELAFNRRFREIVEQMPYTFQLYDLDGNCEYANPAWERLWQSPREELAGFNILKSPSSAPHLDLLKRAFNGEPVTFPETLFNPQVRGRIGRPLWVRKHFFPIRDTQGKAVQIAQMVEDVTPQVRLRERETILSEASKALSESLELDVTLSNIARICVNKIADFCFIDLLKPDGSFNRVQIAAADGFDQDYFNATRDLPPRQEEIGHPSIIAHREGRAVIIQDTIKQSDMDAARRKMAIEAEIVSLAAIPLRARGSTLGVMLVLCSKKSGRRFGTEEIQWLEELADRTATAIDNANLYLASKQAVIARDTFMSTASHELKTPLTMLQLQISYAAKSLAGGLSNAESLRRVREFSSQTERQIQRLARLVDDMLDISRIASGRLSVEPESLDLTELTREVCARLQPLAADYQTSIQLVPGESVYGEWDGHRLDQVLTNLLTNAFRYGGKDPIEVHVWEEGEHAFVSVRDRGRGIAKEDQARIFQRYERAVQHSEVSGFGLGLYIAKEIITLHQGTIQVESEVGQGATFTIRLPLHPPS